MGLFFKGIPDSVLFSAKLALGPSFVAVETGTFKGSTAKKLSSLADYVTTIEANEIFYRKALTWVTDVGNITPVLGESGVLLGDHLPNAEMNCLVWLDAHFSGGITAGEFNPCPLINELSQILPLRNASNSIILIDDSRGLIGESGWPLLSDLVCLLNQHGFSSLIIDDVLVASSSGILKVFADNYSKSRTSTFEKLGGRMTFVTGFSRTLGFATSAAFKVKHAKYLLQK